MSTLFLQLVCQSSSRRPIYQLLYLVLIKILNEELIETLSTCVKNLLYYTHKEYTNLIGALAGVKYIHSYIELQYACS